MIVRLDRLATSVAGLLLGLALLGLGCKQAPTKQVTIVDGVEVVSNPAVPLHKNPGRVLELTEKLRIRDTGDVFYFKSPADPQIAPDGSIFLMDIHQLMRFSPDGAFLGSLIKPGQGPGEIEGHSGYLVEGDSVFVADGTVNKVVRTGLDGRFRDERRLEDYCNTITRRWYVGLLIDMPRELGILADATHRFLCASRPDGADRKTYTFLGKFFVKPPVYFAWDRPAWAIDAGRDLIFLSLSRDYGIRVLDLDAGRVIRSFRRDYPSLPYIVHPRNKAAFAQAGVPTPDHAEDILELFSAGDSLWVRTSTVDDKKGQLFDVFSAEGDFLDSFYVRVKGKIIGIRGDTIFTSEEAEDGTIAVVLYENLEAGRG